jgi:hypothetical protein
MEEWKSILCLWFTALLLLAATVDGQKQQSLEKSSSASDEVGTNFSGGFHGRHGRNRFGKLSDSEESGVYKVEECLGGMGMMDTARIEPKVCDMDNLLGRGEKDLIKIALRELETVTSQVTTI